MMKGDHLKAIELLLTNQCNLNCIFCHSACGAREKAFPLETSKKVLLWGRKRGVKAIYFSGGEPTVREDLNSLIGFAEELDYTCIHIVSNGIKMADAEYVRKLSFQGANEIEISLFGHDGESHDALTQVPGSFTLALEAIRNVLLVDNINLEVTVLINCKNYEKLPELANRLVELGVRKFNLWLISLFDAGERIATLLPKISQFMPFMLKAIDIACENNAVMVTSQVPRCFFPKEYADHVFAASELELLVVEPGGKFMLEESPFEGGLKVPVCADCSENEQCLGLREDYICMYGTEEVHPL